MLGQIMEGGMLKSFTLSPSPQPFGFCQFGGHWGTVA